MIFVETSYVPLSGEALTTASLSRGAYTLRPSSSRTEYGAVGRSRQPSSRHHTLLTTPGHHPLPILQSTRVFLENRGCVAVSGSYTGVTASRGNQIWQ